MTDQILPFLLDITFMKNLGVEKKNNSALSAILCEIWSAMYADEKKKTNVSNRINNKRSEFNRDRFFRMTSAQARVCIMSTGS